MAQRCRAELIAVLPRWLAALVTVALFAALFDEAAGSRVAADPGRPSGGATSADRTRSEDDANADEGDEPEVPAGVMLAPVGANAAGRAAAEAELRRARAALALAQRAERQAARGLGLHESRRRQADGVVAALSDEEALHAARLAGARGRLRELALAGYVAGGAAPVDYLLRSQSPSDLARRRELLGSVVEAEADAAAALDAARRAASARTSAAVSERDRIAAEYRLAAASAADATARREAAEANTAEKRMLADLATAAAPLPSTDIPRLFVDAYQRAAVRLGVESPRCRLHWTALAAIGRIESGHGRSGGARLALNGDVWPRIFGPPLDGTRFRRIEDTDAGELDGDIEFDRAVGPMQFLPSTWEVLRRDANGDNAYDPHNAYDAAAAAGAYLCRAAGGVGLDTEDGQRRAFFSYNRSEAYVETVLAAMRTYQEQTGTPVTPPAPAG